VPISAAAGGATFAFENRVPERTSLTAGPIFAERAPTLGRGRLVTGASITAIRFSSLRGVPLRNLGFFFTHQDVGDDGLGTPLLENDFIQVRTSLDINLVVTTAVATYGLTEDINIGVAVPFVFTSLSGSSSAQIHPFGSTIVHLFAGTPERPVLDAAASTSASAAGVGDIALRVKANLARTRPVGFSILADTRLPTGNEDDFHGSGDIAVRALGIASARLGTFSPHANFGFLYRAAADQNEALLATVGFDQLLAPWATLAVDFLAERQVGSNHIPLPGPVHFSQPFPRELIPTVIPNSRDDISSASIGFKLTTERGLTFLTNAILPMGRGGLRADAIWTLGLEYSR
jgi:hypothetical protein